MRAYRDVRDHDKYCKRRIVGAPSTTFLARQLLIAEAELSRSGRSALVDGSEPKDSGSDANQAASRVFIL